MPTLSRPLPPLGSGRPASSSSKAVLVAEKVGSPFLGGSSPPFLFLRMYMYAPAPAGVASSRGGGRGSEHAQAAAPPQLWPVEKGFLWADRSKCRITRPRRSGGSRGAPSAATPTAEPTAMPTMAPVDRPPLEVSGGVGGALLLLVTKETDPGTSSRPSSRSRSASEPSLTAADTDACTLCGPDREQPTAQSAGGELRS